MHGQATRIVRCIAAQHHLVDRQAAVRRRRDPRRATCLGAIQPQGERAGRRRGKHILQFQAVPGVQAGHTTVVEGVVAPVVDGQRGAYGINVVGHPADKGALRVQAHELDCAPVDRVAQVVVTAHVQAALPADGLADIGIASGAFDHHRLEAGRAAMGKGAIKGQAVARADIGAGPVAWQAATLKAIAEDDIGGAAAGASESHRLRTAASVVADRHTGSARASRRGCKGHADRARGSGC